MAAKTSQRRVLFTRCPKSFGVGFLVALCLVIFSIALTLLAPANRTYAATSPTINFQARLMNSNGSVTADGSYVVEFKVYSAVTGGSALWTEDQTLSVANGYLTANLGSVTTFSSSIPWGSPLWLTMNVNSDGEMSPRLSLTSVPSALSLTSGNGGTNVSTLVFAQPTASEQIILPAESGATQTVCYQNDMACGFATSSGSGSYIRNQTTLQTNANFDIQGVAGAPTAVIESNGTNDALDIQNSSGVNVVTFQPTGVVQIQTSANSFNALQVSNSSGYPDFTVSTQNGITTLGNITNVSGHGVSGQLTLADGTNDNYGIGIVSATLTNNRTITLPDISGTAMIVQGSTPGTVQSGNFDISGTGIAATALQTPGLDTASAGALTVGATNATSVAIGNATAATAISIQGGTGASAIGLTAAAAGSINITTTSTGKVNLSTATSIVAKTTTNQVTGFQVQNASSIAVLNVDTQNSRVGINNAAPNYALDVTGDINASTVLRVAGTDVCDTTGATGCIAKSGSGYYIHNQATQQTGANFYIQGTASSVTGVLEANGADVLDLQNASAVNVVTFSSTGATLIKPSTSTTTALQVQNATTTADVIDADTTNDFFGVNTSSPSANFQVNQSTLAPGTVTNSASSASVTGTGTTFTTTFSLGDTFTITSSGNTCTISAITDNTHLTCASTLAGLSSGSAYTTGNAARFVVQNNGNIGVGTSAPTRQLDIATNNSSTSTPQILVEQAGAGDASLQFKTPAKSWIIGANSSNSSSFSINSSTAANNATLGNLIGGTTDSTDQNHMECTQFTAGTNGTVTSISVKMNNAAAASPNNNFSMAVYTGSGTQPTTLVASTTTGTLAGIGTNTLTLSFSLVNGTVYWMCANNNSTSSSSSNWGYDTGAANNGWFIAQTFGTWPSTISGGTGAASTQKFAYWVNYTPTGSFSSFSSSLFTLTDTGQLTLQNSADSTGELNVQNAAGNSLLSVGSSNAMIGLGATGTLAVASTVNVATSTGATQTINIGSGTSGSAANGTTILIQGGNTATAVSIQALAAGTISVGTANAANTIQVGSTTLSSGTQTIGIGNNATSGGTTNITIGTSGSAGGTTALQAKGALSLTGGAASTWQLTSGTLTIQSAGNVAISGASATVAGTATSSFTTTGGNLSITDSDNTAGKSLTIDASGSTNGTLNLGNSTPTINIDSGSSNTVRTVNIANSASITSAAQTVTIGTAADTGASTIALNGGTNGSASVTINTGTQTATTSIGNSAAGAITLQSANGVSINASINGTANINTGTSTGAVNIGNSAAGNIAVQTSTNLTLTSGSSSIPLFINEISGTVQESAIGYELGNTLVAEIGATNSATHIVNQSIANDLGIKSLSGNVWIAAGSSQASVEISKADGSEILQSTSAAALNVQTSGGVAVFQVNTTNKDIIIGGGASDPTGVDGAMYYNPSTKQFRCYNNSQWEDCQGLDSDAFRQQPLYATDFLDNGPLVGTGYLQTAAPWTGYQVGNGTTVGGSLSTQTAGHPGVVRLVSGTSANTGIRYALNGSAMFMTAGLSFELTFNVATIANTNMRIGFFDSSSPTAPSNGMWIAATGSGSTLTINGKTAGAGTTTTTGTSYSGAVSTWYRAKIVVNAANTGVNFYLYDDSGAQLWTDSSSTNLPNTSSRQFGPGMIAYSTNTTATNLVDLDYMALWWSSALAR